MSLKWLLKKYLLLFYILIIQFCVIFGQVIHSFVRCLRYSNGY